MSEPSPSRIAELNVREPMETFLWKKDTIGTTTKDRIRLFYNAGDVNYSRDVRDIHSADSIMNLIQSGMTGWMWVEDETIHSNFIAKVGMWYSIAGYEIVIAENQWASFGVVLVDEHGFRYAPNTWLDLQDTVKHGFDGSEIVGYLLFDRPITFNESV